MELRLCSPDSRSCHSGYREWTNPIQGPSSYQWIVGDQLGSVPQLRGVSLGIAPGAKYEKREIRLSPGESVVFVTDGVMEAENERRELFGQHRLLEYVRDGMGPPWGTGLLDMVNAWRGGAEASDDITLLEIWRDRG